MSSTTTDDAGDPGCPYDISSIPAIKNLIENGTIQKTPGSVNDFGRAVSQCPGICMTLVGNGNPDLTGIGLFVHYIIQAVLTAALLGIPFLFSLSLSKHPKLSDTVSRFRRTFLEFNAYAVLAIAVSCFVRFFQYASVYELTVVQAVVNFEAFIILVCLFYYPATDWSELDDADAPWSKEMVYLVFFLLVAVANTVMGASLTYNDMGSTDGRSMRGVYLAMFGLVQTCSYTRSSSSFSPALQELKIQNFDLFSVLVPIFASAYLFCRFINRKHVLERLIKSPRWRRRLLPVMPPHIRAASKSFFAFAISFDLMTLVGTYAIEWAIVAIVLLWAFAYMAEDTGDSSAPEIWFKRVRQYCETCWKWLCRFRFLSWLEKPQYLRPVLWSWPVAFFCGWYPASKLLTIRAYRRVLTSVLDNNSPENYWGIGQVAALLAWLPLLVQAAAEAVSFYISWKHRRSASTTSPDPTAQLAGANLDSSMSLNKPTRPTPTSTPATAAAVAATTHDPGQQSEPALSQDDPVHTIHRTGTASSVSLPDADQRFRLTKRPTIAVEEGIRDS